MVTNYLLDVEYDGSGFYGWQIQPQRRTVQGVLRDFLSHFCGPAVRVTGAGRTDRGVHARHMPVTFCCDTSVPTRNLLRIMHDRFPPDLRALSLEEVEADFHARHSARRRSYEYLLGTEESVFSGRYRWNLDRLPEPERLYSLPFRDRRLFMGLLHLMTLLWLKVQQHIL